MTPQSPSFIKKLFSYFFITLLLLHTIGCNYYQVNRTDSQGLVNLFKMDELQKRYIIHQGDAVYTIQDISADSTKISGTLTATDEDDFYYKKDENKKKKYKKSKEGNILYEVHIYLNPDSELIAAGYQEIPLNQLNEIHIIDKDKGRTTTSYVLGTLGVIVGVVVIVGVIVALTKSSCPYVYVHDGESFVFAGEVFGGAILKNLEREDYLPLPEIQAVNGEYQLRISNELKERQYTNLAELITVNHRKGDKVLLDKYGNPFIIGPLHKALKTHSISGNDLTATLQDTDKEVFFFNDEASEKNEVYLKFKKPEYASQGQLVLNAKNTLWLDYLYGEFSSKFGNYYDTWNQKQEKIPSAQRMQKVKDQGFPLSVYQKINGEWKFVDQLLTIGPLASRDFVIPIDLNTYETDFELKLETGFMFWEVDYVGMNFTPQDPVDIQHLKAHTVLSSDGINYTEALQTDDDNYLIQEKVGSLAELHFKATPPKEGMTQSVFLHTKGYYELIREFEGNPDIFGLMKFQTPGYFMTYSKEKYLETLQAEPAL